MVVGKMKFTFQKRVKLAQGLWLLSWMATLGGAVTFTLGCFLKTELRRRGEVSIQPSYFHLLDVFCYQFHALCNDSF